MQVENIATVDTKKALEFIRWFCGPVKTARPEAVQRFDYLMEALKTDPAEAFATGLLAMIEQLGPTVENPLARLSFQPLAAFEIGIMLGYGAALASTHPSFDGLLASAREDTGISDKVTPISAARARK